MASAGYSPPHSCRHCQKMVLDFSEDQSETSSGHTISEARLNLARKLLGEKFQASRHAQLLLRSLRHSVLFDMTLHDLASNAADSCLLSGWLLKGYSELKDKEKNLILSAKISRDMLYFGASHVRKGTTIGSSGVQRRDGPEYVKIKMLKDLDFHVVTPSGNPAAKSIRLRPVNINPASEDAFLLAHGWLQTCLKTHGSCPKPTGHFTPTRLLEISYVGNLRRLRLRTMEFGAEERYAALTYCWGGDGRFTTTTRTIRQHMIGISFQDLPPSLQDAVLVTEKLDLRLLWVDALCVVQDDKHDKALEISQMPSVYSHATVTIAASRASRVGEGFLTERAALGKENPEKVFELPYRCLDGEMGSVVLIPRIRESTEPLDRRAWALQERLLSTRILEYGSLQTMWTCLHSERKNDLVDGWRDRTVMNNERSDGLFIEAFQTVLSHELGDSSSVSRRGNLKSPLGEWHQLVKIYTHRALTLPTDRLPAISGIAERYARILRDEYVCGFWKSTLPQELLWTRSALAELNSRPQEYQGPSWSWAAINSAVRLYSRAIPKAFEVVECHVEPRSKDAKFGAVRSGHLKVRGYVRPVKWIRNSNIANTRQYDAFRRGDVAGPDAEIAASMSIDSLENEFTAKDQIEFVNVFLLVVSEPSNGWMEGLVLRPLLNGEYSRLGVFHFSKWCLDRRAEESEESRSERCQAQLRWFCGPEPQEITII